MTSWIIQIAEHFKKCHEFSRFHLIYIYFIDGTSREYASCWFNITNHQSMFFSTGFWLHSSVFFSFPSTFKLSRRAKRAWASRASTSLLLCALHYQFSLSRDFIGCKALRRKNRKKKLFIFAERFSLLF